MTNRIQSIPLNQLRPHPDNPNRMSKVTFAKLLRNIEQTGRYEPLIVRQTKDKCHVFPKKSLSNRINADNSDIPRQNMSRYTRRTTEKSENSHISSQKHRKNTDKKPVFELINGYHRWLALKKLGKSYADVIVWDVDDGEADVLLTTLNRLSGRDVLDKKIALLSRLSEKARPAELAKLLPQTKAQIEKLTHLNSRRLALAHRGISDGPCIANPLVFFVSDSQKQLIEAALEDALLCHPEQSEGTGNRRRDSSAAPQNDNCVQTQLPKTRAAKRAEAMFYICKFYLDNKLIDKNERAIPDEKSLKIKA